MKHAPTNLKTSFAIKKKNKLHLLYDPDIPLGYLPKREREKKKSKFSCTDLYMNLCRSFICNILKSETTQMSITE